jgi:uncharacterized protein (DUF697 family)
MERKTRRITNAYSGVAAVAAFFTQPVPMLDEVIVVPIHYGLTVRLAQSRGVSIFKLPWRSVQRIIWYGAGARLVANMSLGLVPVVGAFANSITAVALTEFLARWLDEFLEHPDQPPPDVTMEGLKTLFANAVKKSGADKGGGGENAGTAPAPAPAEGQSQP